jgi:hypothetical protein
VFPNGLFLIPAIRIAGSSDACAISERCPSLSETIIVSRGLAMLAPNASFNQLDHAVRHDKLHPALRHGRREPSILRSREARPNKPGAVAP